MNDLEDIPGFPKYFRVVSPSEISINKEDIFYRDKYNEIINYIKTMITFHEDNSLADYFKPKGAILININPGTDISDFLKLISSNFNLELIEFDYNEIKIAPEKFIKSFTSFIKSFRLNIDKIKDLKEVKGIEDKDLDQPDEKIERKLLIVDHRVSLKYSLNKYNLLEILVNNQHNNSLNFLDSNLIVVWINYEIQDIMDISSTLYNTFDLLIKVPLLNNFERETVYRNFLEKNSKIVFDVDVMIKQTENWEVKDIKQLLKIGIFKQFLNSDLNDISNEITQILLDLVDSGEFLPSFSPNIIKNQQPDEDGEENQPVKKQIERLEDDQSITIKNVDEYVKNIRELRTSEFMLNQLYENAAYKNYTELILIIDKIQKKEPLEENDRRLLANYPFILNDPPNKAQIHLEKAKKRVNSIKQAFGK
ncbi:hypothetical protein LCGC14_0721330 [marine sediment metagenome]|uniref:Uncharacterized protein n=1 Tax=marine sediment metagenome TaxID=412755 RepID=A0A0F9TJK8_9ZZZZ|nr:hypothetical protein [bacterium]